MTYMIRELRDMTGQTQKAFAERYGIPLSTLCKWEQGESSPAPYVIKLIADTIPGCRENCREYKISEGISFYYDKLRGIVSDAYGNEIRISEELDSVKEENIPVYLKDLFENFYRIQDSFNRDCKYDRNENIIWKRT